MSIEELVTVVSPPADPVNAGSPEQWPKVERELGTGLPADFKQFVERYGSGLFAGFITAVNPFSPRSTFPIARKYLLEPYVIHRANYPEVLPYPPFPEPGGLLPWAGTDNGDVLCWLTRGQPDDWPVVVVDNEYSEPEMFEMGMTTFLARSITGEVIPLCFPEDYREGDVGFRPDRRPPRS